MTASRPSAAVRLLKRRERCRAGLARRIRGSGVTASAGHQSPGLSWEPTSPVRLLPCWLPPLTFHSPWVPKPEVRGLAWRGKRSDQSTKGRSSRLSPQNPSPPTKKPRKYLSQTPRRTFRHGQMPNRGLSYQRGVWVPAWRLLFLNSESSV